MTAEALAKTAAVLPSQPDRTDGATAKTTARIAGALYLLVGIFGGFAQGFVEPGMCVAHNAAATAQTIANSDALIRAGVVADLLNNACFVLLAVALFALLRDVNRSVAMSMVVLVAVAAAIASLNSVLLFEGLQVVTDVTYATAFGSKGVEALSLLLLDLQHYGLLAAQMFFGLWLAPLGYLAIRSGLFPKTLGVALIVAAGCYLADLLLAFTLPPLGQQVHGFLAVPCAVAEIWMVLYLLAIGVRARRTTHTVELAKGQRS